MNGHHDPNPTLPVDPDSAPPGPLHARPSAIAAVGAGGLIGAPLRYQLGLWFPTAAGGWPVTTFAINIVGAFLLGLLLEGLARLGPDIRRRQRVRLLVGTGMLGSFTTYSTLAVDTDLFLRSNQWWAAGSYAAGTVLVAMVATTAGIAIAARLRSRSAEAIR
ncbi:CrcB family protein [Rhodococcus sp. SBT000017]|uniref:FluC/FEX family fluoride channel n=1 Tax=unclassified Rhodococcus (in: high G+C Gram-positive bacteria) TaxID=192944 RepID=UPI000B9BAD88|nr:MULTISPECIES: CrcB family protein [unclassified Rhodococcus (in: high G+C Gram-positive bacteria)]OZF06101.1 chromosome condensation protein CrcB [Rhodococcus sp. 15-1154-1]RMB77131.1 CrcB family protein [Rhodococcus sp. SBT000017]